jgi:hypothetical protein
MKQTGQKYIPSKFKKVVVKFYNTSRDARLILLTGASLVCVMEKQTPYSFCSVVKTGSNSVNTLVET